VGIAGPSFGDELEDARKRWGNQLVEIYEIDFRRSLCECLPEATKPVRIRVNTNVIESAVRLADSEPLPSEQLDLYLTVEQLFDRIEDVISGDPYSFEAEYDSEFGFPRSVSWDRDSGVADDEIEFTMGNLDIITTYPRNPNPFFASPH
jgi:hypothetical protein